MTRASSAFYRHVRRIHFDIKYMRPRILKICIHKWEISLHLENKNKKLTSPILIKQKKKENKCTFLSASDDPNLINRFFIELSQNLRSITIINSLDLCERRKILETKEEKLEGGKLAAKIVESSCSQYSKVEYSP